MRTHHKPAKGNFEDSRMDSAWFIHRAVAHLTYVKFNVWKNDCPRNTSRLIGCSSSTTVRLADALDTNAQFCARALHGLVIFASISIPTVKLALKPQSMQVNSKSVLLSALWLAQSR